MSGAQPDERVTTPLLLQKWRDAVFVHWPVAPEPLADMPQAGLSVDTFDGQAWLTLQDPWAATGPVADWPIRHRTGV
jgi:uncharacterized protein YqjF (DUF2071 family)